MDDINKELKFTSTKSTWNTELKKLNDLIISLNKKKLIFNAQGATEVHGLYGFIEAELTTEVVEIKDHAPRNVYITGEYQGISIYVDPNMKWSDLRVLDEDGNVLVENLKDHFTFSIDLLFKDRLEEQDKQLKSLHELIISLNKKVICGHMASHIFSGSENFKYSSEYYEYFIVEGNTTTLKKTPLEIYEVGKFNNISINVDPSMKWNDNRLLDEDKNLLIDINEKFPKLMNTGAILG